MIFIVLVIFAIVCFLALTINIGHRMTRKVALQNAADAAVLSGAVWEARGMNLISILNVAQTELLGLDILMEAFLKTLEFANAVKKADLIIAELMTLSPWTAGIGTAWQGLLNGLCTTALKLLEEAGDLYKDNIRKNVKLISRGLPKVAKAVSIITPLMAAYECNKVAALNKADAFADIQLPALNGGIYAVMLPLASQLPVKEGPFQNTCDHTKNGGPGYRNFLCWNNTLEDLAVANIEVYTVLKYSFVAAVALLPPPSLFYDTFLDAAYYEQCGGTRPDTKNTVSSTSCEICSQQRHESHFDILFNVQRDEMTKSSCDDADKKPGTSTATSQRRGFPSGNVTQLPRNLGGTPTWEQINTPCKYCVLSRQEQRIKPCDCATESCLNCNGRAPGGPYRLQYRYFREIWELVRCEWEVDYTDGKYKMKKPGGSNSKDSSGWGKPYMLEDNYQDSLYFTTLVKKEDKAGDPILLLRSPRRDENLTFGEGGGGDRRSQIDFNDTTWALASAVVYNTDPDQLFNQDWKAKLAPTRMSKVKWEVLGVQINVPSQINKLIDLSVDPILTH